MKYSWCYEFFKVGTSFWVWEVHWGYLRGFLLQLLLSYLLVCIKTRLLLFIILCVLRLFHITYFALKGSVNFKFGVIYAKPGQITDDEMFSNGMLIVS